MNNLIRRAKIKAASLLKSKKMKRHSLVGAGNLWKMKRSFQFDFLINMGMKSSDVFLDIGCGTLRGGIPIINYLNENKYSGIDVRKDVLDEARNELYEHNLEHKNPELIFFENFNHLETKKKFNLVFAFSVLIHFSDDVLVDCLKYISYVMADDGLFFANVNIGNSKEGSWYEFPVVYRNFDFYKIKAEQFGLKVELMDSLHDLGHVTNRSVDKNQYMLKFYK